MPKGSFSTTAAIQIPMNIIVIISLGRPMLLINFLNVSFISHGLLIFHFLVFAGHHKTKVSVAVVGP